MTGKFIRIALALAAVTVLSGCDFLRSVAGRPTSEDLAVLSQQAQERQALEKAAADSAAAVIAAQKAAADSVAASAAAKASLEENGIHFVDAAKVPSLIVSSLQHRFCIMLGTFSDASNAQKLASKVKDAGLDSAVLSYTTSARKAVAAGLSDDYASLLKALDILRAQQFCPKDVWILVNGQ